MNDTPDIVGHREATALTVDIRHTEPVTAVVTIVGDLNISLAEALQKAVTRLVVTPGSRIVLDLSGVLCCDSFGLAVLVRVHQQVRRNDGHLVLAAPPQHLHQRLRATNLERVLRAGPDVAAALATVSALSV